MNEFWWVKVELKENLVEFIQAYTYSDINPQTTKSLVGAK